MRLIRVCQVVIRNTDTRPSYLFNLCLCPFCNLPFPFGSSIYFTAIRLSSFTHFRRSALAFDSHPRLWTPPADPEKPVCPYRIGFQVEIEPHTPPPPNFGDPHHGPGSWRQRSDVDLYSATQTQLVMTYPPLERGNALPSSSNSSATLAITGTLAVGDERGAQLVVCSVAPETSQPPFEVVAKIFDALYDPFENRSAAHVPNNTAWQADVDYTHEAAALDHLHKACQSDKTGLAAPKYFGSWTFSLPISHAGKELKRSVRLVLKTSKAPASGAFVGTLSLSHATPNRIAWLFWPGSSMEL
ncbi:hypothetical protein VTI28DRAFT_9431 [Corynascus sepedonium]